MYSGQWQSGGEEVSAGESSGCIRKTWLAGSGAVVRGFGKQTFNALAQGREVSLPAQRLSGAAG